MMWACEDCGWPWPFDKLWLGAECDSCGGQLIEEKSP